MDDALGNPQTALVLGGTSEIALATVRALAARRLRMVVLAGRDPVALEGAAADLRGRGIDVDVAAFDVQDTAAHAELLGATFERHPNIDVVIAAAGVLGDQARAERDTGEAVRIMTTNYVGLASACLVAAEHLRAQGHGTLVVLSSVAGERARRANFVYGSSKAGLDAFAQGLGDALHGSGARVMIVRPGFVRTRMTHGLDAAPLSTSAEAVAEAIVAGLARRAEVIHVPSSLRLVFSVLRHVPRPLFRKLPLG
jgi:decaprenylphospho-beta-D-erythro-pentofuranosid-2-ulose 2-reductase